MQVPISDLLSEAATLMLVGMSVVFVFLTLLIGAVSLIAYVDAKFPQKVAESKPARAPNSSGSKAGQSAPIAAIAAAIHQYRNKH